MAIPTSRTSEKAEIRIDYEKCSGCGECVSVCKDFSLIIPKLSDFFPMLRDSNRSIWVIENDRVKISTASVFGCIGCGHCMAICPNGAIEIHGRALFPVDLFELPFRRKTVRYEQLLALFQNRRSIREFLNKEIDPFTVDKILKAAETSPMGILLRM